MNHDKAHCMDYRKDKCPVICMRGMLTRDIANNHQDMIVTWQSFKGSDECLLEQVQDNQEV